MKKRVLIITNGLYGGGAERVLQTILKHLDLSKFNITLYSLHQEIINDLYPSNIRYKYIFRHANKTDSKIFNFITKLSNKIKLLIYNHFSPIFFYKFFIKGIYDTEIAFIEGYATRIVGGSTNKLSKKIAWVHSDLKDNHWTDISFRDSKEEIDTYHKFNKVIAVSKSVRDINNKLFPNIKDSSYIYNAIDNNSIIKKALEHCFFQKKQDHIHLITCGRLEKQKGYDRLIKIASYLKEDSYKFNITIIGDGSERNNLENIIKTYKLQDTVKLMGYQENPFPFYKYADCFICSSYVEGFSLVILEAMTLGLPIISTNCSGPNELVGNSEYGILTENTEDGLYKGIKSILTNTSLLNYYKNKSLERSKHFNIQKTIKDIENIL